MVFNSVIFCFLFLPLLIMIYYLAEKKYRNMILLSASIIFYAWGEPKYVVLMFVSILLNYVSAIVVTSLQKKKSHYAKVALVACIITNLMILAYFKYFNFLLENLGNIIGHHFTFTNVVLPLGISFFTFQSMSYVVDCYRDHSLLRKNPLDVALYVALFPQLVAGPIVRYQTVAKQIQDRTESVEQVADGIRRFLFGMAKKCIYANTFAILADYAFNSKSQIGVITAWIGALCYTLQIYFDFSGYSEMAIGLGKMFGFTFLENFDYPYIASSITEFWRRWHISLGSWFRDYVYIPLGGNRKGIVRQYINIAIVWLATGIWHGANWTFLMWGGFYGVLLMLEKGFLLHICKERKAFGHIYTMLCVIIGWVIFRADNVMKAIDYLKTMVGVTKAPMMDETFLFMCKERGILIFLRLLACTPIFKRIYVGMEEKLLLAAKGKRVVFDVVSMVGLFTMMIILLCFVVSSTYNPFIYFNF